MMTKVQLRLINAYAILIMAERRTINDVPVGLQEAVNIRIAEIEVAKLDV